MAEDLTPRAYALMCTARSDTSICKQVWSKNGKVIVKTLTGKIGSIQNISELEQYRPECARLTTGGQ